MAMDKYGPGYKKGRKSGGTTTHSKAYTAGMSAGFPTSHPEKTTSPGVAKGGYAPEGSFSGAGANVKESRAISGVARKRGSHKSGMSKKKSKAPYM